MASRALDLPSGNGEASLPPPPLPLLPSASVRWSESILPTSLPHAGPAEIAAAAAVKHGPNFLNAVDVKQRPLVAYNSRSKIPRINRCDVTYHMPDVICMLMAWSEGGAASSREKYAHPFPLPLFIAATGKPC